LWYPTRIDSADLPSNSSSIYVEGEIPVSWSKIKRYSLRNKSSPKILWQSYMSSRVATMECGDTPSNSKMTRCQKVRMYPTQAQAKTLRTWMKAARKTYNRGLHLIKSQKVSCSNYPELKKLVVTSRPDDDEETRKMKESPADIRVRAILDLRDAFITAKAGHAARLKKLKTAKSRWAKQKKQKEKRRRRWKRRKPFEVRYKSKRFQCDSFGFESKSVKYEGKKLYLFSQQHKFKMKEPIRLKESFKYPVDKCCRVQCHYGRWYFLLPYTKPLLTEPRTEQFAALDPGVRTFQTYYSDLHAGEIGVNTETKIDALNKKVSGITTHLQRARIAGAKAKIKNLRRAWYRANARASNVVTDLHWKTVKYLLDEFDVVIAPRLNVQRLLQTNLPVIVKKRMVSQRHGEFINRLIYKAKVRGKTVITDFEEHGTSMTCGRCGHANRNLGSSKNFKCELCEFTIDRDINSSRTHAIKHLVGKKNY
jgi:putative transposase